MQFYFFSEENPNTLNNESLGLRDNTQNQSVSAIEVSLVLFGNAMWPSRGPIPLHILSAELHVFGLYQDGVSRSNGRVFVEVVERSNEEICGVCSCGSIGQVFGVWNVHGSYCYPGYKVLVHDGVVIHHIIAEIKLRDEEKKKKM